MTAPAHITEMRALCASLAKAWLTGGWDALHRQMHEVKPRVDTLRLVWPEGAQHVSDCARDLRDKARGAACFAPSPA